MDLKIPKYQKMSSPSRRSQGGFTMIEIISVVVLVGILAAVVVGKLQSFGDQNTIEVVNLLKNQLRAVQLEAMKKGGTAATNFTFQGLQFDATGYRWIKQQTNGTFVTDAILPSESTANVLYSDKNNVTITTPIAGGTTNSFTIFFDSLGIPYTGTTPATATAITGNLILTISAGSFSATLQLSEETGFIQ